MVISKTEVLKVVHHDEEHMKGYIHLIESVVTQQIEREIDLLTVSLIKRLSSVLQRLGDTLRFLVYHNERHIFQAENILRAMPPE